MKSAKQASLAFILSGSNTTQATNMIKDKVQMKSDDIYQVFDKPFDQMINTNTITELHQLQTKLTEQSKPRPVTTTQLEMDESPKISKEDTSSTQSLASVKSESQSSVPETSIAPSAETQSAPLASQPYQLSQVSLMSQMSAQNQLAFEEIKDSLTQAFLETDYEVILDKDPVKKIKAEKRIKTLHIQMQSLATNIYKQLQIVKKEHVDSNCPGVRQIITLIHSIITIRYEFITIERRMGTLKSNQSDEFMDQIIDDLRDKSKQAGVKDLDKMWETTDQESHEETDANNKDIDSKVEDTVHKHIIEIREHIHPKYIDKPFQKAKKQDQEDDENTSVKDVQKKLEKQVKTQDSLDKKIDQDQDNEVDKSKDKSEDSDDDEETNEENSKDTTKKAVKKLMKKQIKKNEKKIKEAEKIKKAAEDAKKKVADVAIEQLKKTKEKISKQKQVVKEAKSSEEKAEAKKKLKKIEKKVEKDIDQIKQQADDTITQANKVVIKVIKEKEQIEQKQEIEKKLIKEGNNKKAAKMLKKEQSSDKAQSENENDDKSVKKESDENDDKKTGNDDKSGKNEQEETDDKKTKKDDKSGKNEQEENDDKKTKKDDKSVKTESDDIDDKKTGNDEKSNKTESDKIVDQRTEKDDEDDQSDKFDEMTKKVNAYTDQFDSVKKNVKKCIAKSAKNKIQNGDQNKTDTNEESEAAEPEQEEEPPKTRFNGSHFIKWDTKKKGGRWFECNIREAEGGLYWADDPKGGWKKEFSSDKFSLTKVIPNVNDTVIVYYDKRPYAFKGTYMRNCTEKENGKFIDFDDGSSYCQAGWQVHKLESISTDIDEEQTQTVKKSDKNSKKNNTDSSEDQDEEPEQEKKSIKKQKKNDEETEPVKPEQEEEDEERPKTRFNGSHFIKWDTKKKGGRWFECNIRKAEDDKYWADAKDGSAPKKFTADKFSQTLIIPNINDTVIVYYDKRNFAFKGKYVRDCTEKKNGKFIDFDDGSSYCQAGWQVHKLESISTDEEPEAVVPEAAEPEQEEEPPKTRFNGSHFIKWDNKKKGGRWFECNIREAEGGLYWADDPKGSWKKEFTADKFSKTLILPNINDTVIVYYDKRNFAFKGKYVRDCTEKKNGKFIDFDDGSSYCQAGWQVHKLESISTDELSENEDALKTVEDITKISKDDSESDKSVKNLIKATAKQVDVEAAGNPNQDVAAGNPNQDVAAEDVDQDDDEKTTGGQQDLVNKKKHVKSQERKIKMNKKMVTMKVTQISNEIQKNIDIKEKLELLQEKETKKMSSKINKAKLQLEIANKIRQKAQKNMMKKEDELETQRQQVKKAKKQTIKNVTRCSREGGYCKCDGEVTFGKFKQKGKQLTYKEMKKFSYKKKDVKSGLKCTSNEFGGDPLPFIQKQCFCNHQLPNEALTEAMKDKKKKTQEVIDAIEETKKANKEDMQAKKLINQQEKKMQAAVLKLSTAQKKVDTIIKKKLKESQENQKEASKLEVQEEQKKKQVKKIAKQMKDAEPEDDLSQSSILTESSDRKNLIKMLNLPTSATKAPRILFKASEDGWTGKEFLNKVKGVNKTLTIVKQKDGKIIGGYTNLPWYSVSAKKYIQGTFKSFLFTMNTDGTFNRWDKTKADKYGEMVVAPKRLAYFPYFFRLGDNCNVAKSASASKTGYLNKYWTLATTTPVPAAKKYYFQCAEIETYSLE